MGKPSCPPLGQEWENVPRGNCTALMGPRPWVWALAWVEFQISTHTQSCSCTFILSGWPQRPLCIVTIHFDHQLKERDGLRVHAHESASGYLLALLGRLGV